MARYSAYIINTIIILAILGLTYTGNVNAATSGNTQGTALHSAAHHTGRSPTHHIVHTTKATKTKTLQNSTHKITNKPTIHKTHKTSVAHKVHKSNRMHQIHQKRVTTHKTKTASHPVHKNNLAKRKHFAAKRHVQHVQPPKVTPALPTQSNNIQDKTATTQQLSLNTLNPTQNDGQRLVSFVHEIVSSLRYTRYASGAGTFDSKYGVYKLDCSHYVDNILHRVEPRAYASLEMATGATMPDSANYYAFFTRLSSNIRHDWDKIDDAKELQPGDVLVFRYKSSSGETEGGHVMVVMNKPVLNNDALIVQVSDSAFSGHSDDTRLAHNSGVGIGTLLLKVNTYNGQPSAYAWEFNSPWKNRVNIVMARPSDIG